MRSDRFSLITPRSMVVVREQTPKMNKAMPPMMMLVMVVVVVMSVD